MDQEFIIYIMNSWVDACSIKYHFDSQASNKVTIYADTLTVHNIKLIYADYIV